MDGSNSKKLSWKACGKTAARLSLASLPPIQAAAMYEPRGEHGMILPEVLVVVLWLVEWRLVGDLHVQVSYETI